MPLGSPRPGDFYGGLGREDVELEHCEAVGDAGVGFRVSRYRHLL